MYKYNQELEELIDVALEDGVLTAKEKQVLFKKAKEMGVDLDEFEMVLDSRLAKLKKEKGPKPVRKSEKNNTLGKDAKIFLRLFPWLLLVVIVIWEWVDLYNECGIFGLIVITIITLGVGGIVAYHFVDFIEKIIDYCRDGFDNIADYFRNIFKV